MSTRFRTGEHQVPQSDVTDVGSDADLSWLLLVDDDAITGRAIARWVSRACGLPVRLALDEQSAAELLSTHGEPTAVLSDFELRPGEDGVRLLGRLRSLGCRAPAAILTGAPERALHALAHSGLDEVVPVFAKLDSSNALSSWLEQLSLCWAHTA
jgi:CheY-like chemotaxis protein